MDSRAYVTLPWDDNRTNEQAVLYGLEVRSTYR